MTDSTAKLSPPNTTGPRHTLRSLARRENARWHTAAVGIIGLLSLALALVGLRVSGDETVRFGTEADRVYIVDGFYVPEDSAEQGAYRWTEPLAQLRLLNWGPGEMHVAISGVGAGSEPGKAVLKVDGVEVNSVPTLPGQAWTVQGWGTSTRSDPAITLEGPPLQVPGDSRTLGRLVKEMSVFAPDARLRAWANLALIALGALFLYAGVVLWSGRVGLALLLGAAVVAVVGPLALYRDRWMQTVAWALPLVLGVLLLVTPRLTRSFRRRISRRAATALACMALTAALFLLALGYMNAFDSDRMYQMTAGLYEYGAPTRYPGHATWTKYGFGQSLVAVPFYALGKLLLLFGGTFDPLTRFTVSLTNLAVTAITCWLLYRASRLFAPSGVSVAVAATYLLCTPALNYARTFFSEPAGGALLLAAVVLILPAQTGERAGYLRVLLAGVCLGAMIWFKPAFAIYIPAPGLIMLWQAWRSESFASTSARLKSVIRAGLLFGVGPLAGLFVQIGYNYVRYGDLANWWLRTGYEKEPGFSTPLLEGLGGLLLSPGKSIFLYAPVLLLAPAGLWLMFRHGEDRGRVAVVLILAETTVALVFNAAWWAWTGNFAWGPRLIMPVLPLIVWPLASVGGYISQTLRQGVEEPLRRALPYLLAGLWVGLGVLGALVSIPGALVDFQVYYRLHGLLLAGEPGEASTIYDAAESPLVVEPGYLLNGLTAAIHRPTLSDAGMSPGWDVAVPAALVLIAGVCLWLALHRGDRARA